MKSEGFTPDNLSDKEKAKLAAEAEVIEQKPKISKEDLVTDSESFDVSVDAAGKVSRKSKVEKKSVDKEKIKATKIALEKETDRMKNEAELLKGGAEYIIDEKGGKRLELTKEQTEKIAADKKAEDQEKIAKTKAERYGIKDVSIAKNIGKGVLDTTLSIFGARFPVAAAELYSFNKNKKGAKAAASELLETITLKNAQSEEAVENPLTHSQLEKSRVIEEAELIKGGAKYSFNENGERVLNMTKKQIQSSKNEMVSENAEKLRVKGKLEKKIVKSAVNPEENIEIGPVRDRIRSFNEKLKSVDLPAAEKQELRNQMAAILKEHRHDSDKLEAQKVEKVAKTFDVFASSSSKVMGVAKEAVNTVSIFAMMPWLRGVGYTAFSGAESFMKAGNEYDRKHFKDGESNTKERLSFIGKSLTVDSAKETYNSLVGNFYNKNEKGERMGFGKALLGAGLKTLSIGGAALRLLGIGRFEQQIAAGNPIFKEGGEKLVAAIASGQIGEALRQGGENWVHNVQNIISIFDPSSNNEAKATTAYMAKGTAGAGKFTETEEIKKLATIGKGEGIIHAFTRQMEHDPKAFGFHGDINDKVALHKWAQIHSYKAAIDNHFIDLKGHTEIRIDGSATPQQFVLHPDLHVNTPNPEHLYMFDQQAENARVLADSEVLSNNAGSLISSDGQVSEFIRAQEANNKIHDIYSGWYSGAKQGETEWQIMQDKSASDILNGKFGHYIGSDIDMVEIGNRDQLQGYLKELHDKSGLEIVSGETVHDYIMRSNDVHSLSMADYVKDQAISEYIRTQEVSSKVRGIFQHWFSFDKQGLEEWKVIKDIPARDVALGKFGKFVGEQLDTAESSSRDGIQKFVKTLAEKTKLVIGEKETVEAFILRANKIPALKV